ncbi:MAG: hypothetical protein N2645_11300 [Clostridia bacterium]|nr:hypothetical protein [Clostridia bacterium]
MNEDYVKMAKAKNVLLKIVEGINPVNGNPIENADFLKDQRIQRCMIYVAEVLGRAIRDRKYDTRAFVITEEQKMKISLPEGKIGITQFVKSVNTFVDLTISKKLTAVNLNRQLKKLGILDEVITEKGKTRTYVNENSYQYGIEVETKTFEDRSYEMIVFNEAGKKYLLENLEMIMGYEEAQQPDSGTIIKE